jgi:tetratricopeptide (TPR) repeat protein
MVRDWFKGAKALTVNELILRKDYEKAIELISAELEKNRRNERLRLQLGHLLALVGRKEEAIGVLDRLADDLAGDGFAAKAIAVLKKIQKLDPDRSGVEERLATLIEGKTPARRRGPAPWEPRSSVACPGTRSWPSSAGCVCTAWTRVTSS